MTARPKLDTMSVRSVVALYREFEQVARRSDVSLAQYRMLLYLARGPRRAGVIAAASALKKPTVSVMLNSLRERGWIEQVTDPDDARAASVSLTEAGRQRILTFEKQLAAGMARYASRATLDRMRAALGDFYDDLRAAEDVRLAEIEARLTS